MTFLNCWVDGEFDSGGVMWVLLWCVVAGVVVQVGTARAPAEVISDKE